MGHFLINFLHFYLLNQKLWHVYSDFYKKMIQSQMLVMKIENKATEI